MKLSIVAALGSAFMLCASLAQAAPITGEELGTPTTFAANSTNALNYAQQTPGRGGQVAPFVIFVSNDVGELTLSFSNGASGLAFFEIRIDGIDTGTTIHPVVSGDTIHTGGVAVNTGVLDLERTFAADDVVEVRLALGGERDWDFNWTAFYVQQAEVPEPATMAIFGLGLAGLAMASRRRRSDG